MGVEIGTDTIMGGSEYWNGPTKPQYPNFYYCNRSMADIPGSGCVGHHTPPGECSDEHSQFGDSFRPIEITGSAIGGWFGAKEKKERRNATEIWEMWVSAAASFAPCSSEASTSHCADGQCGRWSWHDPKPPAHRQRPDPG